MKKLIKIATVAVLMASSVGAGTLEEYNQVISSLNDSASKQAMLCERERNFIKKDPTVCIKAAQISLKEYEAMPVKIYNSHKEHSSTMYSSAGMIYYTYKFSVDSVRMFKKAVELLPNHSEANAMLGYSYINGGEEGVEKNKIKAYEHLRVAAMQGNQGAQDTLNALCNESPWACK